MENTSGQGNNAIVPTEIDNWNWGAFLTNWIWGIGNNTFIALLVFVPMVGFVMPFVLGAKGSRWAWRNKKWESIEEFKRVQRKWMQWSLIFYAGFIVLMIGLFFLLVSSMKSSDAFKLAMDKLESNPEVMEILGKPVSAGMVKGSMKNSGTSGDANISFSVSGPNGNGILSLKASKQFDKWEIESLVFEEDKSRKRIDLKSPQQTTIAAEILDSAPAESANAVPPTVDGAAATASDAFPEDVTTFRSERERCDHFRGEEAYDESRRQELMQKLEQFCKGTDIKLAALRTKYVSQPEVIESLKNFEDQVE